MCALASRKRFVSINKRKETRHTKNRSNGRRACTSILLNSPTANMKNQWATVSLTQEDEEEEGEGGGGLIDNETAKRDSLSRAEWSPDGLRERTKKGILPG